MFGTYFMPGQQSVYLSEEQMTSSQDTSPTESAPAERQFMHSVRVPLQAEDLTVNHKRSMAEFKIDYQIRRDDEGNEFVYKVYLPSRYKGWVMVAERKDVVSPEVISREAEKPAENQPVITVLALRMMNRLCSYQGSSVQVLTAGKRMRLKVGDPVWLDKFKKVNGVVSPSLLEPGQPPTKNPLAGRRTPGAIRNYVRNFRCPICGDCYPQHRELKSHFVACVRRNGNPQGFYWDDGLNDDHRTGRAIAALYCKKAGGEDQNSATSTSDKSSDHDYHTSSYEPSQSSSDSRCSISRSRTKTPTFHHEISHCIGPSQSRARADHDEGNDFSRIWDKQVADWGLQTPQVTIAGGAETSPKTGQLSEQLRNSPAHTLPLEHMADTRAWLWTTTPETPTQHESKVDTMEASGHDSIHDDFDPVHTTSKTTVPTPTSSRPDAAGEAYCFLNPISAQEFIAGTPPGRSPALPVLAATSLASNGDRPSLRPLPSSPLSGAEKRQLALEPSPLAQGPKRQRMLPSGPANPPQAKTAAGPNDRVGEQGPKSLPVTSAGTALGLSRNGPKSGEEMALDRVGMRQSKGAGLRIDTQAAEFAIPLSPRTEPTDGEMLYADYVRTHKILRGEVDNLTHELCSASERAKMAELRARKAENMHYQTNSASFQKLKGLEDKHKADTRNQEIRYRMLGSKLDKQEGEFTVLEARCRTMDRMINDLKRQLVQGRAAVDACVRE